MIPTTTWSQIVPGDATRKLGLVSLEVGRGKACYLKMFRSGQEAFFSCVLHRISCCRQLWTTFQVTWLFGRTGNKPVPNLYGWNPPKKCIVYQRTNSFLKNGTCSSSRRPKPVILGEVSQNPQKKKRMEFRGYFCPPAAWGPFCFPLQMIWKEERLNSTIVHPGSLNISPWNPWIFLGPTIILRLHFGNFGWVGKLGIESHQMVNLPLKYPAKIQSSRWRMLTIFGGMKVFIPDLFQQKILEIESCTGQVWPSVSFSYVRLFFLFF